MTLATGMLSPISSPQNAVAVGYLDQNAPEHAISFAQWIAVAVPFGTTCLFLLWGYICVAIPPTDCTSVPAVQCVPTPWRMQQWLVLSVSVATAVLWCTFAWTAHVFGDLGVVALLPAVIFFGSGVLNKVAAAARLGP